MPKKRIPRILASSPVAVSENTVWNFSYRQVHLLRRNPPSFECALNIRRMEERTAGSGEETINLRSASIIFVDTIDLKVTFSMSIRCWRKLSMLTFRPVCFGDRPLVLPTISCIAAKADWPDSTGIDSLPPDSCFMCKLCSEPASSAISGTDNPKTAISPKKCSHWDLLFRITIATLVTFWYMIEIMSGILLIFQQHESD